MNLFFFILVNAQQSFKPVDLVLQRRSAPRRRGAARRFDERQHVRGARARAGGNDVRVLLGKTRPADGVSLEPELLEQSPGRRPGRSGRGQQRSQEGLAQAQTGRNVCVVQMVG